MSTTAEASTTAKKGKKVRRIFSFDIPPPPQATEDEVSQALAAHEKIMEQMRAKDKTSKALSKEVSIRLNGTCIIFLLWICFCFSNLTVLKQSIYSKKHTQSLTPTQHN
jgi:hypothetical protein